MPQIHGPPFKSLLEVAPERPLPRVRENDEVLVRVHAVGVNRLDVRTMRGDYLALFVGKQKRDALPFVPGLDVSGTVVVAGLDCRRIKKGDQVFGFAQWKRAGGMAEYVLMKEKELVHKPANLTHVEAAALPVAGTAAYKAMIPAGMVDKGHKVLVLGGAGGVGTLAVQLGKRLGAHVACTCSSRHTDLMQRLGADFVIDYTAAKWNELLRGENFDTVVDCVGARDSWKLSQEVLSPSGTFVNLVADRTNSSAPDGERLTIKRMIAAGAATVNRKFWSVFGGVNYETVTANPNTEILGALREIAEAQAVAPVIDRVYRLEQAEAAINHVANGHATGKVVISIVPDSDRVREEGDRGVDYSDPSSAPVERDLRGGGDGGEDGEGANPFRIGDDDAAEDEPEGGAGDGAGEADDAAYSGL